MNECKYCKKKFIPNESARQYPKTFCSYSCYEHWLKENKEPNCTCVYCGMPMYRKPYQIKRAKHGVTCSKECASKLKSIYYSGEGNHQYGLIGDKNASFKGAEIMSNYGYILEYAPSHPFPHDKSIKGTRVFQHRLVIERNADKFDNKYFVIIDNKKYLSLEYEVHHINEIKTDNRLENLQIVTASEHRKIHCKDREIIRDSKGKIIGVKKLGKIGEDCDVNPELSSDITKGSEDNVTHSS